MLEAGGYGFAQFTDWFWVIGIGDDETDLVGSVTEIAVTMTVFSLGMSAGAV